MILSPFFLFAFFTSIYELRGEEELPLAPYNVKLFCRSGVRNVSSMARNGPIECPSSSTSCGYLEFETRDPKVTQGKIGLFECVDSGILLKENNDYDDDVESENLFSNLCGAVPRCSILHLRSLNTNFLKYVIASQNIQLKMIAKPTVKFCCALYHSTLNRLVNSGNDQLPSIMAPPVRCGDVECGQGSIGCLLHSRYGKKGEFDGINGKTSNNQRRTKEKVDDSDEEGEYIEEYEVDEDELVLPPNAQGRLSTNKVNGNRRRLRAAQDDYEDQIKAVEISFGDDEDTYLKGMDVIEYEEVPAEVETGGSTKKEVILLRSGGPGPRSTAEPYTSMENVDDGEEDDDDDQGIYHCVYRHLNDERYRYCLLIHSEKDGDRCYEHKGHSICCCFVPPDQNTCDPTDLDLVVPAPSLTPKKKLFTTPVTLIKPDGGLSDASAENRAVSLESPTTPEPTRTQIPATKDPLLMTTTTTPVPFTSSTTMASKKRKGRPRITATAPPNPNLGAGCRIIYPGPKRNDGAPRTPKLVCTGSTNQKFSKIYIVIFILLFLFLFHYL